MRKNLKRYIDRLADQLEEQSRILYAASVLMDGRTARAKDYASLSKLLSESASAHRLLLSKGRVTP